MSRSLTTYAGSFLLALALAVGCATAPAPEPAKPATPAPSAVTLSASVLAPKGRADLRTLNLALDAGNAAAVVSWTVEMLPAKGGKAVMSWNDKGSPPKTLAWGGLGADGGLAPEGDYLARLSLDYGTAFTAATAESSAFVLVVNPPTADLLPNPLEFPYVPSGELSPLTLRIALKAGLGRPQSWSLTFEDPAGQEARTFAVTLPESQVEWDGRDAAGKFLTAGATYSGVLRVVDEYGNTSERAVSALVSGLPGAENSSITTAGSGFSPVSVGQPRSMDLAVVVGSPKAAVSWGVDIKTRSGAVVRHYAGTAADVPSLISWDGKDATGAIVPDASYLAALSVDYGTAFKPASVESRPFSVVTATPKLALILPSSSLKLAELSPYRPMVFTLDASSAFAQMATWELFIRNSRGVTLASFSANWPNATASWGGTTADGSALVPGASYAVLARIKDEYGNVGSASASFAIDGLPAAPEESKAEALAPGLAPSGISAFKSLEVALYPGNASAVETWRVQIVGGPDIVAKTYGDGTARVPSRISWNGRTDSGSLAPEGTYHAELVVGYGLTYAESVARSADFILATTAPKVSLDVGPALFSPDGDGEHDVATFTLKASGGLVPAETWALSVADPEGTVLATWKGRWPAEATTWDGTVQSGMPLDSATDYKVVATVSDSFGNVGSATATLATDVLVIASADGYRIRMPSIVFKPFTADYRDLPAEQATRNLQALDLLASKLAKFPNYRILVEGHAVMINWDDKAKGAAEQEAVLIPLSLARAEAIKAALVERGLPQASIDASGVGAKDPLVPDSDLVNRWKNRRVEFYLLK